MDNQTMLRNHSLFQKSWTGWKCDHTKDHRAPGQSASAGSEVKPLTGQRMSPRTRTRKTLSRSPAKSSKVKDKEPDVVYVTVDPLSSRRDQRVGRRKPWSEETPKTRPKSGHVEMYYETFLPKNKWVEYRTREFVTNPRYGQLYSVRKEKPAPKPKEEPTSWLWEKQFQLWRMEIGRSETDRSKRDPANRIRDLPKGQISNRASTPVRKKTEDKPHADLFAAYHNQQLANQRRNLAATVIQRHVRGWVVRMRIANMKRQSLLALGRTWPRVTRDYRELVTRTQARHGVMRTSCPFKLSEMEDYLHKREKYERVFERVATGDKLSRDQLKEFIEACGHYPTEGEITAAFNAVFRGSGATAELVFVLDCSTSLGIVGFHDQMTFVKDVVRTLDVGPDRVRVGVVPYNTDVFHVFGLLQHTNKQEVIEAVDKIRFRPGLTHTGIALAMMRDVFKDARPGVQKVAVVVTDGQSHDRRQTALEAKKAADANITVFAIGVGNNVEHAELEEIAGDAGRVYMCSNYHTLQTLKHLINSKLCLRACTLCQHILPRVELYGLYKAEALDILFTLFVLPATGLLPPTPSLAPAAMRLDHASKGMLVPPPPSSSSCLVFDEGRKGSGGGGGVVSPQFLGQELDSLVLCEGQEAGNALEANQEPSRAERVSESEEGFDEDRQELVMRGLSPPPKLDNPSHGRASVDGQSNRATTSVRRKSSAPPPSPCRGLAPPPMPNDNRDLQSSFSLGGVGSSVVQSDHADSDRDVVVPAPSLPPPSAGVDTAAKRLTGPPPLESRGGQADFADDQDSLSPTGKSCERSRQNEDLNRTAKSPTRQDSCSAEYMGIGKPLEQGEVTGELEELIHEHSKEGDDKRKKDNNGKVTLLSSSSNSKNNNNNNNDHTTTTTTINNGSDSSNSSNNSQIQYTEFRVHNKASSFSSPAFYTVEEVPAGNGPDSGRSQNSSEVGTDTPSGKSTARSGSTSSSESSIAVQLDTSHTTSGSTTPGDGSSQSTSGSSTPVDGSVTFPGCSKANSPGTKTRNRDGNGQAMADGSMATSPPGTATDVENKAGDVSWGRVSVRGGRRDVCRPLSKTEALDVVWTLYPPRATGLPPRRSRWIRPLVDGEEAWSLLDNKIIRATDFKVCLGLVVKSKLERDGVISIPSDVRSGVEEATTYDEAMEKIDQYIEKRRREGRPLPVPTD